MSQCIDFLKKQEGCYSEEQLYEMRKHIHETTSYKWVMSKNALVAALTFVIPGQWLQEASTQWDRFCQKQLVVNMARVMIDIATAKVQSLGFRPNSKFLTGRDEVPDVFAEYVDAFKFGRWAQYLTPIDVTYPNPSNEILQRKLVESAHFGVQIHHVFIRGDDSKDLVVTEEQFEGGFIIEAYQWYQAGEGILRRKILEEKLFLSNQ